MMWGYGNGPASMMMGWGGWMAPFGMIIWLLILGLIVAGIVWLFRTLTRQSSENVGRRSSALDVLEDRYARGEINRDEYLEKRHDIG
jgi:putative membrane protein